MRDLSMEKTLALKLECGRTLRQELENVLIRCVNDGESQSFKDWFSEVIYYTMEQNGFANEDAEKQVIAAIRYMCK